MSKKPKVREARKVNGKKAVAHRMEELAQSAERMEAFINEHFPDAQQTPVTDKDGNVVAQVRTLDVASFADLVAILQMQYPSMNDFDVVAMANAAWQKEDFTPSEKGSHAPAVMRTVWDTYFRYARTVSEMRSYIDVMREALFDVGNYTLIDAAIYGHPSPRDNAFNEAAGNVVRPGSVMAFIQAAETCVIVNAFLNFLRHDAHTPDADYVAARDYLNTLVDGAPHPYRILAAWWDGEPPTAERKWVTTEDGLRVPNPEVFECIRTYPCLIPEYMESVPAGFASALRVLLDPTGDTSELNEKIRESGAAQQKIVELAPEGPLLYDAYGHPLAKA